MIANHFFRFGRYAVLSSIALVLACSSNDGGLLICADGTRDIDGECVPDGTVICGIGTTYNVDTGACEAEFCGEGLTYDQNGTCVRPVDAWNPDVEESDEPNNMPAQAASFALPSQNGGSVTLGGCITPFVGDDGRYEADYDVFAFTADGPMLLDILAEGADGLSAAFIITSADTALTDYRRIGANLVNSRSQRQVWLPKAATYYLAISDSHSILNVGVAGSEGACYQATVTRLSQPTPQVITGEQTAELHSETVFFRYQASQAGVISVRARAPSASSLVDLVIMSGGTLRSASSHIDRDAGDDAQVGAASLSGNEDVLVVLDPVYQYGLTPVETRVDIYERDVYLDEGQPIQIVDRSSAYPLVAFFATAGDIIRLGLTPGADGLERMRVFAPTWTDVSRPGQLSSDEHFVTLCPGFCGNQGRQIWMQVAVTGYYYINLQNPIVEAGETFTFQLQRQHSTPVQAVPGTPIDLDLATIERGFVEIDPALFNWGLFTTEVIAGDVWSGNISARLYLRSGGSLSESSSSFGRNVLPVLAAGGSEFARILVDSGKLLVSVGDFGGHDGDEVFRFTASEREHTDLGSLSETSPVALTGRTLPPDGVDYYLVHGNAEQYLRFLTTTTAGMTTLTPLRRDEVPYSYDEYTVSTADGYLGRFILERDWHAFSVTAGASGATYDVSASVQPPQEVVSSPGLTVVDGDSDGATDSIILSTLCTISQVTVDVNVTGSMSDLKLILRSPNGIDFALKLENQWLPSPDGNLVGNFPDTWAPVETLSDLMGQSATGTWKLTVTDDDPPALPSLQDDGYFHSWALNFYCDD